MMGDLAHRIREFYRENKAFCWLSAGFIGANIADFCLTMHGVSKQGASWELNPLARALYSSEQYALDGAIKLGLTLGFVGLSYYVDRLAKQSFSSPIAKNLGNWLLVYGNACTVSIGVINNIVQLLR
jgi:hypothetical protein